MHIPKTVISTALVAVALGLASPAVAQHRGGGGQGGHGGSRGGASHGTAVPRASAPRAAAPAPRGGNGSYGNYGARADRGSAFNNTFRGPASRDQRYVAPRSYPGVRGDAYRNNGYRSNGYRSNGYRSYGYGNYGYRYNQHGYGYYARPPVRFIHPYYSFRPRFSLGFGLWVGYPVPYTYSYYDPFYYGDPYAYGYPSTVYPSTVYPSTVYPSTVYPASPPPTAYPQSSYPQTAPDQNAIGVQPGQANTGGLSFDITPGDAQVFVDGNVVGTVGQFTPSSQPLGLPAGRHQVEVQAPGYETISFEVDIIAGQVIPYQGSMERR